MKGKPETLILGGGLAGLTAADALASAGFPVTCLEGREQVGGLARNVVVRDHLFDIGGHRFFTHQAPLLQWLQELMGDELLEVTRRSRILMNGRFSDYPLRPVNAFFGMGVRRSLSVLAGYAAAGFQASGPQENFEQWVVARFGRPLYRLYFEPYTRKAWGRDPTEISARWAAQRIQLLSLAHAVYKAVIRIGPMPKTYANRFHYPRRGIGRISERLRERVEKNGGVVRTSQWVRGLKRDGRGRFRVETRDGSGFEADRIISTIPLPQLAGMLGEPIPRGALTYRSLRCVFLLLDRERVSRDTWVYLPDSDILFARLHEPKNWSEAMAPGKGTSLCLEIFCDEEDRIWRMPSEEIHRRCASDLVRLGLIREKDIIHAEDLRVKDAYPVFLVGYEEVLEDLSRRVARHGVHLLGRTGAFTYANMDQVMGDAMELVRKLEPGS